MIQRILLPTFITLCFFASSAFACTCGPLSVSEAKNAAGLVFLGEAVSSQYQKGSVVPSGIDAKEELTVRFKVERWWKGGSMTEVVLFTEQYQQMDGSLTLSICAMQYELTKRYLVYGYLAKDGKFRTVYCSRTSPAEEAKLDLRQLGKGVTPTKAKKKSR